MWPLLGLPSNTQNLRSILIGQNSFVLGVALIVMTRLYSLSGSALVCGRLSLQKSPLSFLTIFILFHLTLVQSTQRQPENAQINIIHAAMRFLRMFPGYLTVLVFHRLLAKFSNFLILITGACFLSNSNSSLIFLTLFLILKSSSDFLTLLRFSTLQIGRLYLSDCMVWVVS